MVAGLGLVALGLGNWATGAARLNDIAQSTVPGTVSARTRALDAALEADVEVARVRQDFYHVVSTGGRLMVATGIVLVAFGAARARRDERTVPVAPSNPAS